jgi:hypothetical protein
MSVDIMLVDRYGASIGLLESASVEQIQWNLNDKSTAQIQVPTLDPVGVAIELMKTEWQVWINDRLEFWGFAETMSGNTQVLTFNLVDLLGYFTYRFITNTSLTYTSIDQVSIAYQLISQMQSGTYQDFNIGSASPSLSGHVRSRDYQRVDHKNCLDLLKEFPALDDGFDFSVECVDSFGVPGRFFTTWYPTKGSYKPNYTLEWGKNIVSLDNWGEDGTKLATLDYATGGSDASGTKVENHYEDTGASAYFGQFQAITANGSEIDPAWLLAKAQQEVANRNKPLLTPSIITVGTTDDELVHNLVCGDTVPVYIKVGRIQLSGEVYRITQKTFKGDNTCTFTMGRIPVPFQYPADGQQ